MPPAARKHTKGMSPKHAVKAHISRSTGPNAPIFCSTTLTKYESMSPNSQTGVRNDTRGKLANLDAEAAAAEHSAKRRLFGNQPGSSAAHVTSGSPIRKKKNNKGEVVAPDSPDCGLPEWHPARDGLRKSMRICAYSPEKASAEKAEPVD